MDQVAPSAWDYPAERVPALERLIRSTAHSAGCEIAALYVQRYGSLHTQASFGITWGAQLTCLDDAIAEISASQTDGLLILDDADLPQVPVPTTRPAHSLIHFAAIARVTDPETGLHCVLVVADTSRHAGLSGAETYVLQTHALQMLGLLDLPDVSMASRPDTERLRLLESVVVNANDSVLITCAEPIDLPGPRIVYCNAAFTRTTGYAESEVLGLTPRLLQSGKTDRAVLDRLRAALAKWEPVEVELLNRKKDGTEFWVELSIVPVADEKGWFTHWVSVQREVTHRKAAEEAALRARVAETENRVLEEELQGRKRIEAELLYAAFHDDLTRLRNRAYFMDRLTHVMSERARDPGSRCGLLFIDLDRFKVVNDSLGHRAGDLLLIEVARRLRSCIRTEDVLARVGGDEFALLIERLDTSQSAVDLARRVIAAMKHPIRLGKQEVFCSCSIGVVESSAAHRRPEELLRDGDIAMYRAKRHDTGCFSTFEPGMHDDAVAALELQTDLKNALARRELFLHYQPIVDAVSRRIIGCEALIRWRHPRRGLIVPSDFIPAAEETGQVREIGRWVTAEGCRQMRAWHDAFGDDTLCISINASAVELRDEDFVGSVQRTLAQTGLVPHALQIEVTETILVSNPDRAAAILDELRSLGVRFALDDFGTGYSSLSFLDRYPMDTLKIDRSFVSGMLTRARTGAITEMTVRLGRSLDLKVVAEGVEDEAQLQALAAIGCDCVQGYHLGRPCDAVTFAKMLSVQRQTS